MPSTTTSTVSSLAHTAGNSADTCSKSRNQHNGHVHQDAAGEISSIGFFTFFFTCSNREEALCSAQGRHNLFSIALALHLTFVFLCKTSSDWLLHHDTQGTGTDNSQIPTPHTADEHQSSARCCCHSQPRSLQVTSEQKLLSA